MKKSRQVLIGLSVLSLFTAWTYVWFRSTYSHNKRLREVEPGRFYRCGQLTADGFAEAVERFGIRTIINVQEDVPDPDLWKNWFDRTIVKEQDLCKRLGSALRLAGARSGFAHGGPSASPRHR